MNPLAERPPTTTSTPDPWNAVNFQEIHYLAEIFPKVPNPYTLLELVPVAAVKWNRLEFLAKETPAGVSPGESH